MLGKNSEKHFSESFPNIFKFYMQISQKLILERYLPSLPIVSYSLSIELKLLFIQTIQ